LLSQLRDQLLIGELRYIWSRLLGADIEHCPQLFVRLQLAVKLRDCSSLAIDRDVLDQLRSLGREVLQKLRRAFRAKAIAFSKLAQGVPGRVICGRQISARRDPSPFGGINDYVHWREPLTPTLPHRAKRSFHFAGEGALV